MYWHLSVLSISLRLQAKEREGFASSKLIMSFKTGHSNKRMRWRQRIVLRSTCATRFQKPSLPTRWRWPLLHASMKAAYDACALKVTENANVR